MVQALLVILLLEGFITISIEILTIRQLLPFFGGSVVVTSIIIGIFLLFLSLGYWRGGMYRDSVFNKLSSNFTLSLIWLGLGLSYAMVGLCYIVFINKLGLSVLWGLVVYLLLILAPIVYWLGQTLPLTTNLFNQQMHVSHISGKALFISTMGSFLGAILTSLLLFQTVGVAWTLVINCILLFALIVYMKPLSLWSWWSIGLIVLFLFIIKVVNTDIEKNLFVETTNYGNYAVVNTELDSARILMINNSSSSLLTQAKKGFPYIEWIRDLLFKQLKLTHKKILVIGAGGFSLTADNSYNNDVHYVDIDPDIKRIAEQNFLKKPINGTFVGQDARAYLNQVNSAFDVIISDAYSNQTTIPSALLSREYFQALSDHLSPSGLVIINIIANPFFSDKYARSVSNTIQSVFPYCTVLPMQWKHALENVIYVCPKIIANQALYTDDLNSATFDFFKVRP